MWIYDTQVGGSIPQDQPSTGTNSVKFSPVSISGLDVQLKYVMPSRQVQLCDPI